ncbi:MAG: tetratricopeptide repeat protein [Symploca sp. SIO2E9]|nr:tetratricopeptide repeat protein [Symploca sp. SIO2E9]
MLLQGVSSGTGEILERCLEERLLITQRQVDSAASEFKQAKAMRTLRALKTISSEWERVQEQKQVSEAITSAIAAITTALPTERLTALLRVIDPNQQQVLNLRQLAELAKNLQQQSQQIREPDSAAEVEMLSAGISAGLASWQRLEDHLVSWIYDQSRGKLGFEGGSEQRGPWALWAKQVKSPLPQSLFQALALNQPLSEWVTQDLSIDLSSWVELAVVLQCLQRGLVSWCDKMVYDSKVGAKLSISTFLFFAVIWSHLANALNQLNASAGRERLVNGCFQICMQILRAFAQQQYFPLYGGVFANLNGKYLKDALDYLDQPLRQVEGTQEKARILTWLGYSLRTQGKYKRANEFHQQALEIARHAGDRICEIANFNHLSRISAAQRNYVEAINYSQRALMLSRQTGDKLGEANALANLGYSEVFQAQEQGLVEAEVYERAIYYLEQGKQSLEQLGDSQSQALCLSSLGIAHVVIEQPQTAITYLEQGWQAAQFSGDLYLQGLNLAYLAQACYSTQNLEQAVYTGCLGAYLLEQIGSNDWRQPAGLLAILQGQLGMEAFQNLLMQQRSKIIPLIGIDGYEYIPQLLAKYRESI